MRSVAVVLPASICAMMPILRQRFRGIVRATSILPCGINRRYSYNNLSPKPRPKTKTARSALPAIVSKGLVCFRHAVDVFLLLHRSAAAICSIQQFVRELVYHALFTTATTVGDKPANGERGAPLRVHFDRNLVVGAAHTTGLRFEQGLAVLDSLLKELQGLVAPF